MDAQGPVDQREQELQSLLVTKCAILRPCQILTQSRYKEKFPTMANLAQSVPALPHFDLHPGVHRGRRVIQKDAGPDGQNT